MGSRGTGRFGDYKPGSGGNQNMCDKPIKGARLEDVATCDYYVKHHVSPPVGTDIQIKATLFNGRIAVETLATKEIIGLLPTSLNYLDICLRIGKVYHGTVTLSSLNPIPTVEVNLNVI